MTRLKWCLIITMIGGNLACNARYNSANTSACLCTQPVEIATRPCTHPSTQRVTVLTWTKVTGDGTSDQLLASYDVNGNDLGKGEAGLQRLAVELRKLPIGSVIVVKSRPVFVVLHKGSELIGAITMNGMPQDFRNTLEEIARERHFTLQYLP